MKPPGKCSKCGWGRVYLCGRCALCFREWQAGRDAPPPLEPIRPSPVYDELERLLGGPRGSGTYLELERLLGYDHPTGYRPQDGVA